jgi:hypothetical protein
MAVAPEGETPAFGHHVNTLLMGRRKDWMRRNFAGGNDGCARLGKIVQGEKK